MKSSGKQGKQVMKGKSGQVWAILAGIVQLVVGVLLLIDPTGFTGLIVTAFGVFLLVMGLVNAVRYFRTPVAQAVVRQDLAKALAMLILGGFCVCQFQWITAAMPLMSMVYGVAIIAGGVLRSQWSVDMLRLRREYWFVAALGAVAAYVLGVVVLANPFAAAGSMWVCIAVTLIVCAAFDVAAGVLGGKVKPSKAGAPAAEVVAGAEGALPAGVVAGEPLEGEPAAEKTGEPADAVFEQVEAPVEPEPASEVAPAVEPEPAVEPAPAEPELEPAGAADEQAAEKSA